MTTDTYDPLGTSGGSFSDIDATLVDSEFKMDDKFPDSDGNPACVWVQTWEADDKDIGDGGRFTRFLSVGKGWETDNGQRAYPADNPDNDRAQFNGNSKAGRFITAAAKCEGVRPVIVERYDGGKGLTQQDASFMVGMKFHLDRDVKPYKLDDGTKGESEILAPSAFLEVEQTGKKAPKKKAPKKKAASKPAAADRDENGLTAAQLAKAAAIFGEVDGDDASTEFITRCLDELAEIDSIDEAAAFIAAEDDGLFDLLNS